MAVHLPGGLANMLGKVLAKPDTKADAKGLVGQVAQLGQAGAAAGQAAAEALKKGAPLGDGTVLVGAGFSAQDRAAKDKNVHEKDSVARFLKDPELDKVGRGRPEGAKDADEAKGRGEEKAFEAKDKLDAQRADVRREERADEGKQLLARETQRDEQQREREREKERERHKGEEQKQEEADPQWAYVENEREPDQETPERDGHHDADVLGEAHQCKGESVDGVRCLRKPMEGASYCREHLTTTGTPRTIHVE